MSDEYDAWYRLKRRRSIETINKNYEEILKKEKERRDQDLKDSIEKQEKFLNDKKENKQRNLEKKERQSKRHQELEEIRESTGWDITKGEACKLVSCNPTVKRVIDMHERGAVFDLDKTISVVKQIEKCFFELGILSGRAPRGIIGAALKIANSTISNRLISQRAVVDMMREYGDVHMKHMSVPSLAGISRIVQKKCDIKLE